jgi:peptide deformylase
MATRLIRKSGDDILRKKSRYVKDINKNVITLLDDMLETMREANGVGLAAPQVGILKRIIIIDVGEGLIELINPEIIYTEGEQVEIEGCLSVPGKMGEVKRPNKVIAKGLNREGEPIRIEGEGLLAKALCHETDHLDGVLFVDKVIRFVKPEEEEGK